MSNGTSKPRRAMQLGGVFIAVFGLIASVTAFASASTTNLQQGAAPVITPEFCLNRSLGGAATYPLDVNGDGIHDICSLAGTRRATAARQNTLERLGDAFPQYFSRLYASECLKVNESYSAAERAKELNDPCAAPREAQARGQSIPPVPRLRLLDANTDPRFFSGPVVTGPSFCLNLSFGGPVTYPLDVDGDGVADICSLPTTRRATIARQNAYERLAAEQIELFDLLFVEECLRVPATFATTAREALAEQEDACARALRGETVTGGGGGPGGSDDDDDGEDGEDDEDDEGTGGGGPLTPVTLPTASNPPASHVEAPQNIALTPGDEQITVTWGAPLTGAAPFRYHVEWSTSASSWPASQRLVVPSTGATGACSGTPAGGYSCTIPNLTDFQTYYVRVQAVRGTNDRYSPHGNPRTTPSITPGVSGPPVWATTPLASTEYGTINASWTAPSGPTPAYYLVQWSTSPTGWSTSQQIQISTSHSCASGTTFTACPISGLDNNRTYYVRIIGVTSGAGPGTWSLTESLRLASTLPVPGVPTNLKLSSTSTPTPTQGKLNLKVDWDAPTSTTTVTNYLVQWRSCGATGATCAAWSANTAQRRVPPSGTTLPDPLTDTIPNLDPLAVYEVRVRAVNSQVASGWTGSARITLGQSQPPTNITWNNSATGATQIDLSWTAPDIDPAPSYYFVQWSSTGSFPSNCSTSPTCGSTSATHPTTTASITALGGANLVINSTYYVRIRTVNANDVPSVWSPTVSMVPGTIARSTDLAAAEDSAGGNPRQLDLTWTSATPTDRPVQTGFRIRWRPNNPTNPGSWSTRTLSLTQAGCATNTPCGSYSYALTGLTGGTLYDLQVSARNTYGFGPYSSPSAAGTPGAGFAPTINSVTESTDNPRALSIDWSRASWGQDSQSVDIPVTSFVVQARVEGTTNWGFSRSLSLAQAGCTTTTGCASYTYLLTGLTAGMEYQIRVRASNKFGQGAWTETDAAANAYIPGQSYTPTSVSVADTPLNPRALIVTWSWSTSNGAPTGFTVQYRVTDTTNWTPRSVTPAQTDCTTNTAGCSNYNYTLTGLTAGTEYEVRVQARNAGGSGPWSAVSSNQATPGTQLTPSGLDNATITGVNSQTVNWTAVSPTTPLTLRNYTVQWRSCGVAGTSCETWSSSRQATIGLDSETNTIPSAYEITGLQTFYTYEWRVRANYSLGSSPWAESR